MEWILGVLIIILAVVAIFVIYLSERVTVFETLLGINPKVTGEKLAEHVNFGPNPFGELSGKDLWQAMCGDELENSDIIIDPVDLDKKRPRYEFVLSKHLESLLEEGRFDAKMVSDLMQKLSYGYRCCEGSVESYIPFADASRLYEIGQELESNPEKSEKLKTETSEIVDEIFAKVGMDVPTTLIDSMLSMTHSISEDESNIDDDLDDELTNDDSLQLPSPSSETEPENADKVSS